MKTKQNCLKMTSKENVSIIVIGAGISGFTCAAKLIESGFSDVKVLEAEDRIGGRIYTTTFGDGLIDLGAQWCHGVEGNVVHELAGSESFSETKIDFSRMTFSRSSGDKVDGNSCEKVMKLCGGIFESLNENTSGTVDEFLNEKFFISLELNEFENIDKVLAREVLENFKKRECSYLGCEELSNVSVDGFLKFKDCVGPTWLNWKGKGYKTIFDIVLVILSNSCDLNLV